jgi:quinol monooxygenase YgiN
VSSLPPLDVGISFVRNASYAIDETLEGERMATLLAHIHVKQGREAEFEAIAAELYGDTHANEAGCLRYEYWRGAEPGFYYALLAFEDFNTFLQHQKSDHHESASPRIAEVCSDVRLEWIDPVPASSPLPSTVMQELPASADEKTQRYHRIFGATVQPWWPR